MITMDSYPCPYCKQGLSSVTRKRRCPYCGKIIVVRTRINGLRAWVKEEDAPLVDKEWAEEMLRRGFERQRKLGIEILEVARHNIREWAKSGVVKSLKLYNIHDADVCDVCREKGGTVLSILTRAEIVFVMENAHIKGCTNLGGCRCYWRPEKVSIE